MPSSTRGTHRFPASALASWLVLALMLVPAHALAQCPNSVLGLPYSPAVSTPQAAFEVSEAAGGWIRGDHATGAFSTYNPGSLGPTILTARDRFDVSGVPAGTVVNLSAAFPFSGFVYTDGCGASGCCGSLMVALRSGADSTRTYVTAGTFLGRTDFSDIAVVPFTIVAGTPRDLEIEIYSRRCAGGAHSVTTTGTLSFTGLTGDQRIVSCKGYSAAPVPVRSRSWGQLKTIYR